MIDGKKAISLIKNKYPKAKIYKCFDYDDNHYIVLATESKLEDDYDAPYYAVDKQNGKVTCFSPGENFNKFFSALTRPVDF